jgi:NAD(P)H dehydrogenase (quinone)
MDADRFAQIRDTLGQRLDTLWSAVPIAFRKQNGGDYAIPELTLRPQVAQGQAGFAAHVMGPEQERAAAAAPAHDQRIAQT